MQSPNFGIANSEDDVRTQNHAQLTEVPVAFYPNFGGKHEAMWF